VELCGSQEKFRPHANILKRLVRKWGPEEAEYILRGAIQLGYESLLGLATNEGSGQRKALEAYLKSGKRTKGMPESIKSIFRRLGEG
jgi:hypothetical protein